MAGPFFRTPAKRNFEIVENFPVTNFLLNRSTTVFLRLFQDGWVQKEKIAWSFYAQICLFNILDHDLSIREFKDLLGG